MSDLANQVDRAIPTIHRPSDVSRAALREAVWQLVSAGESTREGRVLALARSLGRGTSWRLTSESEEAWERIRGLLAERLPGPTFELWIDPLVLGGEHKGALVVVGKPVVTSWVTRRYADRLGDLVRELSGYSGIYIATAKHDPAEARVEPGEVAL